MNRNIKWFVLGFISASVLMFGVFTSADTISEMINVSRNTATVDINGEALTADNFIYNGTTYVPLRAVSEALEFDVLWDEVTKHITVKPREIVMTVGNLKITKEEFENYYGLCGYNSKVNGQTLTAREIFDVTTDELTKLYSVLNKAYEEKIELTQNDKDVVRGIFEQSISFNPDYVNSFLDYCGLTKEEYIKILYNAELYNKYLNEYELKNITVSDDEAKKYYSTHKNEFKAGLVTAKHILFSKYDSSDIELTHFEKVAKKKQAEQALAQIKKGENFDRLMNQLTEDPGIKDYPNGYTFGRGEMVSEFEECAFSLKEGEISEIIETNYGYHIIKLVKKYDYYTYEMVSDYIKEIITNDKLLKYADDISKQYEVTLNKELIEN